MRKKTLTLSKKIRLTIISWAIIWGLSPFLQMLVNNQTDVLTENIIFTTIFGIIYLGMLIFGICSILYTIFAKTEGKDELAQFNYGKAYGLSLAIIQFILIVLVLYGNFRDINIVITDNILKLILCVVLVLPEIIFLIYEKIGE